MEILLKTARDNEDSLLQFYHLRGNSLSVDKAQHQEMVIIHTPGHSPGSISLWKRPQSKGSETSPGILFTGDTYAYTNRDQGRMTGFPRYGNNQLLQSKILANLLELDWEVIAPGHGGVRDYSTSANPDATRHEEMQGAIAELKSWRSR